MRMDSIPMGVMFCGTVELCPDQPVGSAGIAA